MNAQNQLTTTDGPAGSLAVATGSLPASSAEVWLASPDQCATASEASLRRALLTVDGAGRAVKTAALDELLRRHAGCVNVRQPEENAGHEPRGANLP